MALFHLLSPLSVAALLNWTCPSCNAVLPLYWWSTGCNVHEDVILCSSQWWNFPFPCTYLVLIVYSLESTFVVFPMPSKVQPYCLSIFGHPRIIFIQSSHSRLSSSQLRLWYSNSGKTLVWWLSRVDSIPSSRLSLSTHKDTHFGLVGPPILRNIFSHILSRPKKPIPTLP